MKTLYQIKLKAANKYLNNILFANLIYLSFKHTLSPNLLHYYCKIISASSKNLLF
jgi:hypothetical protein